MKDIMFNGLINTFKNLPKEKQILYLAVFLLIVWLSIKVLYMFSILFIVVSIGLFMYWLYLKYKKR